MARKVAAAASHEVQSYVLTQFDEVKRRLGALEKQLVKRGKSQQKELESLVKALRTGKYLKLIEKQAATATAELNKRVEVLQTQVLGRLGVATQSEISQIYRELSKLSKKLDALANRKAALSLQA